MWSAAGLLLELPSGVWADTVSRRRLLVLAPLVSGAGFALWVAAPSYPVFAFGFVLWGAQGALQSGAFEALVYEELEARGEQERFAAVLGRTTACGTAAAGLAMGVAAPVLGAGGFLAVGLASTAACVAAAVVAATLPEHRGDPPPSRARWTTAHVQTLREGMGAVRGNAPLRRAVLAVPAVVAVWGALDEELPLLATDAGASPQAIALYGLGVYAAMTAGSALAARAQRRLTATLLLAAALLAAGALLRVPAGLTLIAASFAAFQAAQVVVEARLQQLIDTHARATVTSLASVLTELAVITTFAAYAAGSLVADHATLFALAAALYGLVALTSARGERDG